MEHAREKSIRVMIVDDQTLFAEGLKTILLSRADDLDVIGTCCNGQEAVEMAMNLVPDIILMDVRMPVMDGVEAVKQIHRRNKDIRIVMLTTFDDDEYVKTSLVHGAIGYLLKNRPPAELIASIRAVQNGVLQIDPAVSKALIHDVRFKAVDEDDFIRNLTTLTQREREVLELLTEAHPNRVIAIRLKIAEQTVRNYTSLIFSKLGIVNRIEILKYTEKIQYYLEHY